jgi:hypothetical protein
MRLKRGRPRSLVEMLGDGPKRPGSRCLRVVAAEMVADPALVAALARKALQRLLIEPEIGGHCLECSGTRRIRHCLPRSALAYPRQLPRRAKRGARA